MSVMNRALADSKCRRNANRVRRMDDAGAFKKLVRLPPSATMQKSGEVFKGQLLLAETETGVFFHKEQFAGDGALPAEYVIADRRYSIADLAGLFNRFEVVSLECVRAGWRHSLDELDGHAKEILGIFRKRRGLAIWK